MTTPCLDDSLCWAQEHMRFGKYGNRLCSHVDSPTLSEEFDVNSDDTLSVSDTSSLSKVLSQFEDEDDASSPTTFAYPPISVPMVTSTDGDEEVRRQTKRQSTTISSGSLDDVPSEVLQLIYSFLLSKSMPMTCKRFHFTCRAYHLPIILPPPCELKLQNRIANQHQLPGCITVRVCAGASKGAESLLHAAVPRHLDGFYLDCTHRSLTDRDVADVCKVMSSLEACEVKCDLNIDMNGRQLTMNGCRYLPVIYNRFATATSRLQTSQIDLSCNSISSASAVTRDTERIVTYEQKPKRYTVTDLLTDTLSTASRVKLNLEWNSIQDIARLQISPRTVERLTCLHLNIGRNRLTATSIDNLTNGLKQCNALSVLHLTLFDNTIGLKGAVGLAPVFAITSLCELHLDMDRCTLGSEGAGLLLAAASTVTGLQLLSMSLRHNSVTRSLNFHAFGQLTTPNNVNDLLSATAPHGVTGSGQLQCRRGSKVGTGVQSESSTKSMKSTLSCWSGAGRRLYIDLYGNNIGAGCIDLLGSFYGATNTFCDLSVNLRANGMDENTYRDAARVAAKMPSHMQFSF